MPRFPSILPVSAIFAISLIQVPLLPAAPAGGTAPAPERVRVADDHPGFVLHPSGAEFRVWGFNYDHDVAGRLLEDYWEAEWPTVEADFAEMRELGANVVRVHLQLGRFMTSPDAVNPEAFDRLARLVGLAAAEDLRLDVTGLGCYHKADVPDWYDALPEAGRWETQARFWEGVARVCAGSGAVFCYDLMNEPILPGAGKPETDWLAGEFGGKHFVQRIALDLGDRTREQVARAWIERLVRAIRLHDTETLITVGVIPWALTFPGARPLFHDPEVGAKLDFVSVHFYPERGKIDEAVAALAVYQNARPGVPVVIEEIFPLKCGFDEMDEFIGRTRDGVAGYVTFYWGRTISEYKESGSGIGDAIMRKWLERFRSLAPEMKE